MRALVFSSLRNSFWENHEAASMTSNVGSYLWVLGICFTSINFRPALFRYSLQMSINLWLDVTLPSFEHRSLSYEKIPQTVYFCLASALWTWRSINLAATKAASPSSLASRALAAQLIDENENEGDGSDTLDCNLSHAFIEKCVGLFRKRRSHRNAKDFEVKYLNEQLMKKVFFKMMEHEWFFIPNLNYLAIFVTSNTNTVEIHHFAIFVTPAV